MRVPNSSIPSHPTYSTGDAVADPLKEPSGLSTNLYSLNPGSWERSKPKAADHLLTLPSTTGLGSGAEPRAKGPLDHTPARTEPAWRKTGISGYSLPLLRKSTYASPNNERKASGHHALDFSEEPNFSLRRDASIVFRLQPKYQRGAIYEMRNKL